MKYGLLVILALAQALSVAAESVFKDGPHVLYPVGGDVRDSQLGFGWQVTYESSDYWSIDLSLSRLTDTLDDLGVLAAPFADRFDLEMVAAAATARIAYPQGLTTFYAGGGIGYYYMRTENRQANRSLALHADALPAGVNAMRVSATPDNQFGLHAALGIERILAAHWEVFAEFRWVWLDSTMRIRRTETRAEGQRERIRSSESFSYDHGLFRAGINYRF